MKRRPEASLTLRVRTATEECLLQVVPGTSVRDVLDTTKIRVRAACGGNGSCGACVVTWISGDVNAQTTAEYQRLQPAERAAGARLACQLRLQADSEIRIDDPAPPSAWTSIPANSLSAAPAGRPELQQHIYGLAVDLGTTHIRLSLWDRKQGRRIATRRGPNPQAIFGADILNRLASVIDRPERAEEVAHLARDAILHALRDILMRDVGEVRPMLAEIGEVFIVGNAAMLALLTSQGARELLDPENWAGRVNYQPKDPAAFQSKWLLPHATISLPDPVSGFIGSDLLADLVATRLIEGPPGSLLLDIGTNTEIALWDGTHLHITAVPGGPAFEGSGLRNGMAAEPGAIFRVRPNRDAWSLETIGGSPERGFCGSGLVDAVACLLASGQLKPSGRFASPTGDEGFCFDPGNPRTALHAQDIDTFQRAKAATAAAMAALLRQAGMGWNSVQRLCVCGAFGHTLDIAHAQAIGLLPPLPVEFIELAADASLAGCEMGLLHQDGLATFANMRNHIVAINLSQIWDYDDLYIDHLRLRPIQNQ
ncbi:MAG: ASKHA domain-containing protein [Azonexus sp.]|nr:ASKHA domain-containing protein [Azonexus sp.]